MRRIRRRLARAFSLEQLESKTLLSVGVNLTTNAAYLGNPIWVDLSNAMSAWAPHSNIWDTSTQIPKTSEGYPLVDAATYTFLGSNPLGSYSFSYRGTGNFTVMGAGHIAGPVIQGSDGVSRGTIVVDDPSQKHLMIYVNGVDPTDPLSDVRLILPGYSPDTTQVYTDTFIEKLQPFSTIRFMGFAGTNNSLDTNWSDRTELADWKVRGAETSWEDIITLGNEAHKDIWINVPALATDDYVRQLATMIHDRLDPSLNVHVEYSNEVWNYGFSAYRQVLNAAAGNPLITQTSSDGKVAEQYAYRSMQISTIFKDVYGADAQKLKVELGGWASHSNFSSIGLSFIATQFGAPSNYFSALSIAPYLDIPSSYDNSYLTLDTLFWALNTKLNGSYLTWLNTNKALADHYDLALDAYEGGQSLTATNGKNYSLKLRAQSDPRMGKLYKDMLTYWDSFTDEPFVHNTFDGPSTIYGFWGLIEQVDDPGSVKWDAVMNHILPTGDLTLDGKVTWSDFQQFRSNYGKNASWRSEGDLDANGVVNLSDLNILKQNLDYSSLTPDQIAQVAVFGQSASPSWNWLSAAQAAVNVASNSTSMALGSALVFDAYGSTPLSNLNFSTVTTSAGSVTANKAASGGDLAIGGIRYADGLSAYGNSHIRINLDGAYSTFLADIGLDKSSASGSAVTFQVWGDGVLLYSSPLLNSSGSYVPVSVNVAGVGILSLKVIASGTAAPSATIADWGAARLSKIATSPGTLSWQVTLDGSVVTSSTDSSFVFRPASIGVYTISASNTQASTVGASSTDVTVGLSGPGFKPVTSGSNQLSLNWLAVSGAKSYLVYRGTSSSPSSLKLYASGITGLSFVDNNAKGNTTYYYSVAAVASDGTEGLLSVIRSGSYTPSPSVNAADITEDGRVDWNDFSTMTVYYGQETGINSWTKGDLNSDGVVNLTDLNILEQSLDYSVLTPGQIAQIAIFDQNAAPAGSLSTPSQEALGSTTGTTTIEVSTAMVFDAYGSSYLSSLPFTTVKTSSGSVALDMAANGKTLRVGSVSYEKGLSAYGNSQIDISLGKAYTTFQADIGLDALSASGSAVTYQVWADGVLLYTSPLVTSRTSFIPLLLDVSGRSNLSLRVISSGTAAATATIADWGAARLSKIPATSGTLTWQVALNGSVISTTTSPSFVFRPTATGVYTITATNTQGTTVGTASTKVNVGLHAPWNNAATAGTKKVTLTWSALDGSVSYVIYRGLTSSPRSLTLYASGITGSSYVDTNVTAGTTYSYAIATVTDDGIVGPLSWSRKATPL